MLGSCVLPRQRGSALAITSRNDGRCIEWCIGTPGRAFRRSLGLVPSPSLSLCFEQAPDKLGQSSGLLLTPLDKLLIGKHIIFFRRWAGNWSGSLSSGCFDDGVLIDVSSTAKGVGFRYPVALTCGLREDIKAIPDSKDWQDVSGHYNALS